MTRVFISTLDKSVVYVARLHGVLTLHVLMHTRNLGAQIYDTHKVSFL